MTTRQDGQTKRHAADRCECSRAKDKAKMECCEEVEEECGQAMYIAPCGMNCANGDDCFHKVKNDDL